MSGCGPLDNMNTGPFFTNSVSVPGEKGGVHNTLICDNNGLIECHSTIRGTNGFTVHDTNFGQTRLTDFFNPTTGKVY